MSTRASPCRWLPASCARPLPAPSTPRTGRTASRCCRRCRTGSRCEWRAAALTADRLTRFITELAAEVPEIDRFALVTAFREVLLNAMEHGAGFDPEQGRRRVGGADGNAPSSTTSRIRVRDSTRRPFAAVATDDDPISHLEEREAHRHPAGRLRLVADDEAGGRGALQRVRQRGHPGETPGQGARCRHGTR